MSVYVGMDVHRKRSQAAVAGDDERAQLNRNVVNGSEPMLGLLGGLPAGTPVTFEAAFGWGWLAGLLEDYGFQAHLVHPLRCKAMPSWVRIAPRHPHRPEPARRVSPRSVGAGLLL